MWCKWLARLILAGGVLPALAEPRLPGMDAQLEADLARADYLFVWDIDRRTLGKGDPYRTLRTYYDGLMFAITDARRLIRPGTPATVKLDPMPEVKGWHEAYTGEIKSHETYLDDEPMVLHAEVTRRDCDTRRSQLVFALSRQPRNDPAWQEMRRQRDALACDKALAK